MGEVKFSDLCGFEPVQLEATRAADSHLFTLFGGTRGPGKSYWLRWNLLRLLLMLKAAGIPSPTVGLFCEDYPTLRDRQIKRIKIEFPRSLGVVKATQEEGLGFHLHSGGMIALRNLDDASKYIGAEFAAIGIDEVTKNPVDLFDILRGSLRWPGVDFCPMLLTGNPGGIGHLWVKQLFIDRDLWPELLAEYTPDDFVYIRGTPQDNPHLSASYWKMLNTLQGDLRRAWLEGDWDVFVGQVFKEWRRHLHVCEPFPIPEHWLRWTATDHGYASPMCTLWLARNPDNGRTVVYRELYEKGLTDPEQADKILELTGEGENLRVKLGDPSMWTKVSTERKTKSTADVYKDHGIRLTKADNDRLIGKRRVHDALAYQQDGILLYDDGLPGLLVFENCANLIRTLPALPYDEVRVEDVDTDAEDHAYDALRYGLCYKVRARRDPDEKAAPTPRRRRPGRQRPLDVPIEMQRIEELGYGQENKGR